jgi:general secretion pathway protein B
MSYILDALKKAERERHAARIPTLETVHRTPWERRRPQWLWIGAAVVLVNAALLVWLLRPEPMLQKSSASPAAEPATDSRPLASKSEADTPAPAPMSPAVTAKALPEPAPSPPQSSASRRPPETTTKRFEAKAVPPGAAAPVAPRVEPGEPQAPTGPARPAPAAPETATLSPPTSRVPPAAVPDKPASPQAGAGPAKPVERSTAPPPAFQELTPADQEGMPKISLQFLVYSDVPSERLIFVNNQKYVEGQSIEGKVVVEGILPDGAILSYQGKRFKLRQ